MSRYAPRGGYAARQSSLSHTVSPFFGCRSRWVPPGARDVSHPPLPEVAEKVCMQMPSRSPSCHRLPSSDQGDTQPTGMRAVVSTVATRLACAVEKPVCNRLSAGLKSNSTAELRADCILWCRCERCRTYQHLGYLFRALSRNVAFYIAKEPGGTAHPPVGTCSYRRSFFSASRVPSGAVRFLVVPE